jgi:hypothetical protein
LAYDRGEMSKCSANPGQVVMLDRVLTMYMQ